MFAFSIKLLQHLLILGALLALSACGSSGGATESAGQNSDAEAAIASLRAELQEVHRRLDIPGFAQLHTDSGVLEWQGMAQPVVGRAALEANRRDVWASRHDLTLQIDVSQLGIHGDHAYEFAAYTERWVDPDGSRVTERGRYVTAYVLDSAGRWRIERIFGFTDSVDTARSAQ